MLTTIGSELYERGLFEEAIERLRESIRTYPLLPDAYYTLAQCYEHIGETAAACEQFEKCLRHEPSDEVRASALQKLGRHAGERGDYGTAIAYYEETTLSPSTFSLGPPL